MRTSSLFSSPLRASLLVGATCVLAGLSLPAPAAVIVQDLNFGFGPLTAHDGAGPFVAFAEETHIFQQFDPSLGTLTAARWELRSTWVTFGSATVESRHTDPGAPVTGIFGMTVGLDSRVNFGGSLLGTGGQYFSMNGQANQGCTTSLASGPCHINLEFFSGFDGVIEAFDLASLTGQGGFEQGVEAALQLSNIIASTPENAASISSWGQTIWADSVDRGGIGQLRLVYDYVAFDPPGSVPEPSSLALAGLALAALLRARRRH